MSRLWLVILWLMGASAAQADVILLLSDDKPSILGVAQAIQSQYSGKTEVYSLNGQTSRIGDVVNAIQSSEKPSVVAIGLLAAQTAKQRLAGKLVVFSQVLNYEEADLVSPWMKGVSAMPSISRQFRTWKTLDPTLKRVGVIMSRPMREALADAQAAARQNGIELIEAIAGSDREALFALRQMAGKIQGLWIVPDSTILSAGTIREMVTVSVKHDIQVLSFSPALLRDGALLAATPDFADIARQVLGRLRQATAGGTIPGEGVIPLTSAILTINSRAAERFNLTISDRLRDSIRVE